MNPEKDFPSNIVPDNENVQAKNNVTQSLIHSNNTKKEIEKNG